MNSPQGEVVQEALAALEREEKFGAPLHEMPREATRLLAHYGIYTTTEPRHPGKWRGFRRTQKNERAHNKIADNLTDILRSAPCFEEAIINNCLGEKLAAIFGDITGVHIENIHVMGRRALRGGGEDGMVTADSLTYTTSRASCHELSVALQAMMKRIGPDFHAVTTDFDCDTGEARVTITNPNEHDPRSFGRAVGALLAREDKEKLGYIHPPEKIWLSQVEARGETFPLNIKNRFVAVREAYRKIKKSASYGDAKNPDTIKPNHYPEPIGTDVAAIFQATRDVFSARIDEFRDNNPEQNPNKKARPWMEKGVTMKRPKKKKKPVVQKEAENTQEQGPPLPHTPTAIEWIAELGQLSLSYAQKHPRLAMVAAGKHLVSIATFGVIDGVAAGILFVPTIVTAGKHWVQDLKEWQRLKQESARATRRVNDRIDELRAQSM